MTTFNAFDSTPAAITQKALSENFNLEEKQRREAAEKNKDFYYGKQEGEIVKMNDDVDPIILNLTKPIMHKRCSMLYSRPLVREWDGPSSSVNYIENLYKEIYIDSLMSRVDLLSELTGSVLIHPQPAPEMENQMRLVLYDATQFSVVGNDGDSSTADAISLIRVVDRLVDGTGVSSKGNMQPQLEKVVLQQIWTNETVKFYEGSKEISQEKNTLGFLPFVNFQGEEVHDQFIGFPVTNIIRKLNAQINQILTHIGYTIKMQAGTPIVFSGFKSGETVVVHPGRAINIPQDSGATTLDLNPKIEETLGMIEFLEDRLYTTSSVPKISVEGGEGESGRELMVRWFPLHQVFEEKTNRYNRYELQLANMILAIAGLEPIADVNVKWPEENILPLSIEDDNLERDIQLNLKSVTDEIMRRNPHMTEKEAEEEYEENKRANADDETMNNPEGGPEAQGAAQKPKKNE